MATIGIPSQPADRGRRPWSCNMEAMGKTRNAKDIFAESTSNIYRRSVNEWVLGGIWWLWTSYGTTTSTSQLVSFSLSSFCCSSAAAAAAAAILVMWYVHYYYCCRARLTTRNHTKLSSECIATWSTLIYTRRSLLQQSYLAGGDWRTYSWVINRSDTLRYIQSLPHAQSVVVVVVVVVVIIIIIIITKRLFLVFDFSPLVLYILGH